MQTQTTIQPNPRYFLNRLALEHASDTLSLDPYRILKKLFANTDAVEMQGLFEQFCEAAVAPAYYWKAGSPGSLFRLGEELEQLMEACYLLYKTEKRQPGKESLKTIRKFFLKRPLPEWKRMLHEWVEASLSNCSVAEIGEPEEMVPFVKGFESLIAAAGQLAGVEKPVIS